jgi:hypothetical protein
VPESRQKKSNQLEPVCQSKSPRHAKLLRMFGIGSRQLNYTTNWTLSLAYSLEMDLISLALSMDPLDIIVFKGHFQLRIFYKDLAFIGLDEV